MKKTCNPKVTILYKQFRNAYQCMESHKELGINHPDIANSMKDKISLWLLCDYV
ncbi:MAG: hypothetical protein H0Z29_07075 [Candidatus Marinimicrobia bacterium]|nr:hypothetical protein [Candidatus Neomarinimicrobiota bacterium]